MEHRNEDRMTIDQVAKLCGVSKTTISRYLNRKYENMSAETRENIRRVIEEVGYRPDRTAQRLKARQSMLIGCVIGDVSSPFSAMLLKGITTVCEGAGYQVLFADSGEDPKRERRAIEGFLENRVDGLIVNTSGYNDDFLLELQDSGVHMVLADRVLLGSNKIDTVTVPSESVSYGTVSFLLGQGYKRVAFFAETIGCISPRILRRKGYQRAVAELGGPGAEPEIYEFAPEDLDKVKNSVSTFRERHGQERIAAFCTNGATAQKVILACKELGIDIGYDFGLCTFDDWSWLRVPSPEITAVSLSTVRMGEEAAQLLLDRLSGRRSEQEPPVEIQMPCRLMVRGSTPGESAP